MIQQVVIASSGEAEKLQEFLRENKLPYADIKLSGNLFIGYTNEEGELIASGGLEFYGEHALLRSLAVKDTERGKKLGQQVVDDLIAKAKGLHSKSVFLLTEAARDFFVRKGFQDVSRDEVPEVVRQSTEFTSVCPASAACMMIKV